MKCPIPTIVVVDLGDDGRDDNDGRDDDDEPALCELFADVVGRLAELVLLRREREAMARVLAVRLALWRDWPCARRGLPS